MGIGESVKRGFNVMKRSMPVVGLYVVYGAVSNVLNIRMTTRLQGVEPGVNPRFVATIGTTIGIVLIGIFFQAGLMGYAADQIRLGKAGVASFLRYSLRYFLRFFTLALLLLSVLIVVGFMIAAATAGLTQVNRMFSIALTAVLALVAVVFAMFMILSPYAVVLENKKVFPAIKQSFSLASRHFKGILLLGLALVSIGFLAGVLLGGILGLISLSVPALKQSQYAVAVSGSVVNAFLGVWMTSSYMAYYLRLVPASANPNS